MTTIEILGSAVLGTLAGGLYRITRRAIRRARTITVSKQIGAGKLTMFIHRRDIQAIAVAVRDGWQLPPGYQYIETDTTPAAGRVVTCNKYTGVIHDLTELKGVNWRASIWHDFFGGW